MFRKKARRLVPLREQLALLLRPALQGFAARLCTCTIWSFRGRQPGFICGFVFGYINETLPKTIAQSQVDCTLAPRVLQNLEFEHHEILNADFFLASANPDGPALGVRTELSSWIKQAFLPAYRKADI